ncbi:class II aldolase/adducin family protein [Antricoccus suffuscus]|uniref:class II aldolase/adducin family protein n=1 Tax=Antricoccus suffuscus TaxID=1629062 RepID=UPI00192E193A|nr:class II aldolase/adducin family protein [Antricoccus suffuscus]
MNDLAELRQQVSDGCRVLAGRDLAPGILGHISVRVGDQLLIRCRGPRERGLAHTTPTDIHLVARDGSPGAAGELAGGWTPPHELPLHVEVLNARSDVTCVVHAHPADVVAADLAGVRLQPIVGAYDLPGAALVRGGVPVYPRSVLINTTELGVEVADCLGSYPVVLMRGHGLISTGDTVAEAVLRAASVNTLAGLSLKILGAGGALRPIPEEDLRLLPDLGATLNLATAWRHELARLRPHEDA